MGQVISLLNSRWRKFTGFAAAYGSSAGELPPPRKSSVPCRGWLLLPAAQSDGLCTAREASPGSAVQLDFARRRGDALDRLSTFLGWVWFRGRAATLNRCR